MSISNDPIVDSVLRTLRLTGRGLQSTGRAVGAVPFQVASSTVLLAVKANSRPSIAVPVSRTTVSASTYNQAVSYANAGNYTEAWRALALAGDYYGENRDTIRRTGEQGHNTICIAQLP